MTVQELIDRMMLVGDKSKEVECLGFKVTDLYCQDTAIVDINGHRVGSDAVILCVDQ